jgi:starvation-inducible DNA-binding protein
MATSVPNQSSPSADGTVVEALQQTLLELIDIALNGKQAHWNVVGPQFLTVHRQLDEVVEAARLTSDEVAERLATIGVAPDGRPATVAEARAFEPLAAGLTHTDDALAAVGDRLDEAVSRLRGRIAAIGEADLISQGILIGTSQQLEKLAWMIRAQRA